MFSCDFEPSAVISSLIVAELARSRRVSALDPMFLDLTGDTEIGHGALGTDSLDLLHLAAAVAEMFHLHDTGVEEDLLRYRTIDNWREIVQASLRKKAERITFRTSGSTGSPKRCVHSWQLLTSEAAEHAARLRNCRRVLSMVPSHHIYGFIWAVLLPQYMEISVLDVRRWSPSRIAQESREGDLLVGVPAHWTLLSRTLDLLPSGVFGVTSGAPCPPALFAEICRAGVDLTEVYGSSETAGIGVRQGATESFALLSLRERESVQAPDYLEWESDRTFRVRGRRDGAVQVGGNNVFPERVADILRSCPGIQDCTVRLMRPDEGDRLKAFVVRRSEADVEECTEEALRTWAAAHLQPFERPAAIAFGAVLPLNEMGKLADW